jgi:hypothetical protein
MVTAYLLADEPHAQEADSSHAGVLRKNLGYQPTLRLGHRLAASQQQAVEAVSLIIVTD